MRQIGGGRGMLFVTSPIWHHPFLVQPTLLSSQVRLDLPLIQPNKHFAWATIPPEKIRYCLKLHGRQFYLLRSIQFIAGGLEAKSITNHHRDF